MISINVKKSSTLTFQQKFESPYYIHFMQRCWLATVNACEKIHFLFLKKKESTESTHTLLALSFFIDDNDVVVFNLSLGTSS